MKSKYLIILFVGFIAFFSWKKSVKNSQPYGMTADITHPRYTSLKFKADSVSAVDTTDSYLSDRTLYVFGFLNHYKNNVDQLIEIAINISYYHGTGTYSVSTGASGFDTVGIFLIYYTPGVSGGGTLGTYHATSGTVSISSLSAAGVDGSFNVNVDSFNYSGSFYEPVKGNF